MMHTRNLILMRVGSLRHTTAKWYSSLPIKWSDGSMKILGLSVHPTLHETICKNYELALNKAENLCKIWTSRGLSLVGKVCVVNTLVASQFLYLLQVLPTPPKDIFDKYDKIIRDFIWDHGKTKIAKERLIQDYQDCGLRLIDLTLKDKSIKISKFKKMLDPDRESTMTDLYVKYFGGTPSEMLDCNLASKDVKNIVTQSKILKDMCMHWAELNYHNPTSQRDILSQKISFNTSIKRNKKPIPANLFEKEVKQIRIADIYDTKQGCFKKHNELRTNLKIPNLLYNGILTAIPRQWKLILQNKKIRPPDSNPMLLDRLRKTLAPVKEFYNLFLAKTKKRDDYLRQKWEKITDKEITNNTWLKISQVKKLTTSTKLQSFQYHLINHAIITNIDRFRWKMSNTDLCEFCKKRKRNSNPYVNHV